MKFVKWYWSPYKSLDSKYDVESGAWSDKYQSSFSDSDKKALESIASVMHYLPETENPQSRLGGKDPRSYMSDVIKERMSKGEPPVSEWAVRWMERMDRDNSRRTKLRENMVYGIPARVPGTASKALKKGWQDTLLRATPYDDEDVASDSGLKSIRKRLYDDYMASGRPQTKRAVDAVRMPF